MRLDNVEVTTQHMCPRTGRTLRSVTAKRSCIAYMIDESDRRIIMVGRDKESHEYPVAGGVALLTKFVTTGKATLILQKRNITILLAKADPEALDRWCAALKHGVPPPPKSEAGRPSSVEPLSKRPLASGAPAFGSAPARPNTGGGRAPLSGLSPSAANNSPAIVAPEKKAREPGRPSPTWQTPPPLTPRSRLLTTEQQAVLREVCAGRSVFFTGGAGVGKSFLLKQVSA